MTLIDDVRAKQKIDRQKSQQQQKTKQQQTTATALQRQAIQI